jgi:hypothetical protein
MPSGTAKGYASTYTVSGPLDIWFKAAVPGANGAPTLHTDGTPEATANPNCVHAGMLKGGGGFNVNAELQERTSDNLAAPYEVKLLSSSMALTGEMLQFNAALLQIITPGASTPATAPSGKTGITLGSISNVASTCVLGIWEQKTTGKYFNVVLYDAYQANGLELSLNRSEDSAANVEFRSKAVSSRATADQVGAIWIDNLT